MKHKHHSKLSIQNDIENLPEAQACAEKVAEQVGFSSHENRLIQLALEEVLSNIIKHSFAPGQLEDIDIVFTQRSLGLHISIWVKGIPFDPALFPVYSRKDLVEKLEDRGLGNYLVNQVMDAYSYINHGHAGIEIILEKNLPMASIKEIIDDGPEIKISGPEKDEKPPYFIDVMKEEEAVEVSRLAYYAYGYTYPYENIYYPEKVARLNQSGEMISMVARLESGEIIGHAALEKGGDNFKNSELGIAFSNPNYRGMGIMNRLWEALIEKAKKEGIFGVYAMSVTSHPYSQKASHHYGLNDICLLLSRGTVIQFKDLHEGREQRESIMITYRYLFPPESAVIYPPEKHKDMILRIFNNIGFVPEEKKPQVSISDLKGQRSIIRVKPDHAFVTVGMQVDRFGEHTVKKVTEDLRQFCIERYESIYLTLNLHDPYTALLAEEFEKLGFFFAGIHPADEESSYLVLQYLNNQKMDYELLEIDSAFGKELVEYVKRCDPNH
ncbi:MAG: GNAT family N-acetyltransferase [Bacteroidales bacterium]|jgi:serine/threonine-protein kinase RsbW|nr:GNAT family N-acetyltransferase [Bacteroidales bacterium]